MHRHLFVAGVAAVLLCAGVAAVGAQRGGGFPGGRGGVAGDQRGPGGGQGRRGGGPGDGAPFMRELNLTDEQRAKFDDIMQTTREQSGPIAGELALARKTVHREAFAEKRDAAKIARAAANVAFLEQQILEVHIKAKTSIADLLTDEQREKVRANADWLSVPGEPRSGARGGRGRG